ncbi:hypothetical protein [Streptomyces griseoruber]|uniref:hypothetical protein n=1 Tax=Streptomyces griseoruber TaxID=1943 RepID=UPI0037895590
MLLREGRDGDIEVYAADDTAGGRPRFTVATEEAGEDDEDDTGDTGDTGDEDGEDGEGGEESLDRLVEERVGPLREAVLYGVPWDGAEAVVLAAAEEADEPPVGELGSGPVRPVTGWNLRRRAWETRRRVARERWYRAQGRSAEEAAERGLDGAPVALRRWRAGWGDWISMAVLVLYATWFTGGHGIRHYVVGVAVSLLAARVLPRRLCRRITADRDGLWLAGFRGPRLLAWDDIRTVRCRRSEPRIVGTRASSDEWAVDAFRRPWLEGRLGVLHRYGRTAAEITAMWRDPGAAADGGGGRTAARAGGVAARGGHRGGAGGGGAAPALRGCRSCGAGPPVRGRRHTARGRRPRSDRGTRPDPRHVPQPAGPAHRGLCQRPLRLSGPARPVRPVRLRGRPPPTAPA